MSHQHGSISPAELDLDSRFKSITWNWINGNVTTAELRAHGLLDKSEYARTPRPGVLCAGTVVSLHGLYMK